MPSRVYGPRGFSDDAVKNGTGKTWPEWTAVLDAWGVENHGHSATAKHLRDKFKLSPWWSQAVTSRYEWEHGLKDANGSAQRAPKSPGAAHRQ